MSHPYLDNLHTAFAAAEEMIPRIDELIHRAGDPSLLGPRLAVESRDIRKAAAAVVRDLAESAGFVGDAHPDEARRASMLVESLEQRVEDLYDRTRIHGDLDLGPEWNELLD